MMVEQRTTNEDEFYSLGQRAARIEITRHALTIYGLDGRFRRYEASAQVTGKELSALLEGWHAE